MTLFLASLAFLGLGLLLWPFSYWHGYVAGFAHAEKAAANHLGQRLDAWTTNARGEVLDLSGVKDRAR